MAQIKLTCSAHGEHMMCIRVYTLVQTSLYPYWGRCGGLWQCRSLPGTLQYSMALLIQTADVAVEYGTEDLYWGSCGRVCHARSSLDTLR